MTSLRPSFGLLGRVFAILLLAVGIEMAVSTLLYERASRLRVVEEEAHRLADLLARTDKLMNANPASERPELARRLSSDSFVIRWHPTQIPSVPMAASLDEMRDQILAFEPALEDADIRFHLKAPGRNGKVTGQFELDDDSWVEFHTTQFVESGQFRFNRMLLALIPAVALILIGGLLLRQLLSPLRLLATAAGRVGEGERIRLPDTGVGEIGRVVRAFNDMQDRIHQLISDRTEALASMGHDLRTPLARMQLRLDMVEDDSIRSAVEEDIHEMEAMISSLLAYLGGNSDPEKPIQTDIAVMAATLVDGATDAGHRATYEGPDHLELSVRSLAFKRALSNMIDNGIKYAGAVEVLLRQEGDQAVLTVRDRGEGIPEHELDHVLEPFVRLDPARSRNTQGMGLGIPIAHRMMLREGGIFRLSNRIGGGLNVEMRLRITK